MLAISRSIKIFEFKKKIDFKENKQQPKGQLSIIIEYYSMGLFLKFDIFKQVFHCIAF